METIDPMTGWLRSLHDRIAADFELASCQPEERAEILARISSMVIGRALMRAEKSLDSHHLDHILGRADEDESQIVLRIARYLALRGTESGGLLDLEAAYDEVKTLALKGNEKANEKVFEGSDQSAEAVGDLLEVANDAVEAAAVRTPVPSGFSAGVDLLFDPARFRRTPAERQRRFFRQASALVGKTLGVGWSGLFLFTVYDALERHHVVSGLPSLIRDAVPSWYVQQSIGGQVLLLVASAAGLIVVGVIVVRVFARAGSSRRLTSAFELKVGDDELASTVLQSLLSRSTFPSGVPPDTVLASCRTIYRSLYLNSGRPNSDDLKVLDEILEGGNEKAAVAFLRSKVRGYRSAVQHEAEKFCKHAEGVMRGIG